MKKRIISGLLALCLVLCLLPTAALAAENRAFELPTSGAIQSPTTEPHPSNPKYQRGIPNSYIWFGEYNEEPLKWRVLDADKAVDGTTPGMFLLTEGLLENISYDLDGIANEGQTYISEWQNSDAQAWCRAFASSSHFTPAEQAALMGVAKAADDGTQRWFYLYQGFDALTDQDKVFFLSTPEVATYISGQPASVEPVGRRLSDGQAAMWWLRGTARDEEQGTPKDTPIADYRAGAVSYNGLGVVENAVNSVATRPACNLNFENVAFASAAQGGKAGTLGTVSALQTYAGNEWKLTLYDRDRKFTISDPVVKDNTVAFRYAGATTGPNEYISIILESKVGEMTHYGRILRLDGTTNGASGAASFTLPEGVDLNSVAIYAFNEQFNGGDGDTSKRSDYASELISVEPTDDIEAPKITAEVERKDDANATVTFTTNEAATLYYAVVDAGTLPQSLDTTGAGTFCDTTGTTVTLSDLTPGAKTLFVVAKDLLGNVSDEVRVEIPEAPVTPPAPDPGPDPEKYQEPDCDGTDCILEKDFDDIDISKWYHLDVEFVYLNGIMKGNNNRTFTPEEPITRAQFIQTLYNIAGNPEVSGTTSFSDVKPGDWWYNAVLWAEKEGITNGNGRGQFEPDAKILREQIAAFLYRQAGSPETEGELSKFTDAAQVDTWAQDAVKWAVEQDILRGYDGKVGPIGNALRCEAAAMVHRWLSQK